MKKKYGILVIIILIIGISIIVFGAIGTLGIQSSHNQSQQLPASVLPKDVPIVKGKIISSKAVRSDDLTRGIIIDVETNLSLKEVVKYYSDEFAKIELTSEPTFQGNAREIENSTEVDIITETKRHLGIVISIQSQPQSTLVMIQIKGNSILFLPS